MSPTHAAPDNHGFVKRLECPPSGVLLAYAGKSITGLMLAGIGLHLAHCDFCSAELQLLGKHPPIGEVEFVPAPLPLFLLLVADFESVGLLGAASIRRPDEPEAALPFDSVLPGNQRFVLQP
jgi:hypothetical protein